jgi:hypothetical protein
VTSFRRQRASRGTTTPRFLLITRRFSLIVSIYGPPLVIRLTSVFRLALSAISGMWSGEKAPDHKRRRKKK